MVDSQPVVVGVVLAFEPRQLPQVLAAIDRQTHPPSRVIVVDNGSVHRRPAVCETTSGNGIPVELLRLERNEGVGAGHNAGWRRANEYNPNYIWALEHDTLPEPYCLEQLLAAMDSNGGSVGAVVPRQVHPEEQKPASGGVLRTQEAFSATFNALLLRSGVFEEVGEVREDYVVGLEDRDYARRLLAHGWRIIKVQSTHVVHENKRSRHNPWPDPLRSYYSSRNSVHLLLSDPGSQNRVEILLRAFVRAIGSTIRVLVAAPDQRVRRVVYRWQALRDGASGRLGPHSGRKGEHDRSFNWTERDR